MVVEGSRRGPGRHGIRLRFARLSASSARNALRHLIGNHRRNPSHVIRFVLNALRHLIGNHNGNAGKTPPDAGASVLNALRHLIGNHRPKRSI